MSTGVPIAPAGPLQTRGARHGNAITGNERRQATMAPQRATP
jgi:hypothetical protein